MRKPLLPVLLLALLSAVGCDRHKKASTSDPAPETDGRSSKGVSSGKGGGKEKDPSALDGKELVADLGFRPNKHGFSFPNFRLGDPDSLPLGPRDLKKMCGEKAVCVGGDDDDECQLKSGAQAYLNSTAKLLGGGHCEGFSVGSLRLWAEEDSPDKLGASKAFDLDRDTKTERYLAYWAASQMSPSVAKATYRAAPNKVLARLITAMKNKSESFVLGIHRADGMGGHAIVPYAVEDRGDDIFWVYVYENNSPGKLRHVEFNKAEDTWRYDDAATMTDEKASTYAGSADHPGIELIPQSARNKMACPFAPGTSSDYDDDDKPAKVAKKKPISDDDDDEKPAKAAKKKKPAEDDDDDEVAKKSSDDDDDDDVMLVGRGSASLAVTDDEGHTLGVKDGYLVSEIPGATYAIPRGLSDMPPILFVPAKTKVKLSVRGDAGKVSDVAIIGKKFAATLTKVPAEPKPEKGVEIFGKGKQIAFFGGAPAAQKVELFFDAGKKVQKLEMPVLAQPLALGHKVSVDFGKGKLAQVDGKGALVKPIVAAPMVVAKPTTLKKLAPIEAVGAGKLGGGKLGGLKPSLPAPDAPKPDALAGKPGDAPKPDALPGKPGDTPKPSEPSPGTLKPGIKVTPTPPAPPPAAPPPAGPPAGAPAVKKGGLFKKP
jgi:hypothetical protein